MSDIYIYICPFCKLVILFTLMLIVTTFGAAMFFWLVDIGHRGIGVNKRVVAIG